MILYTVRRGDSPPGLARRFSFSAGALARLNGLDDRSRLAPGLALAIPGGAQGAERGSAVSAAICPACGEAELAGLADGFSLLCPCLCRVSAEGGLIAPDEAPRRRAAGPAAVLPCLSNLSERGGFSAGIAHALLCDSRRQDALLSRLLRLLDEGAYQGLCLYFQYLFPFDREAYGAFVRRAAETLHASGRLLMTVLAAQDGELSPGPLCAAQDHALHGEAADWVLLCCEKADRFGAPGPIAPLSLQRAALAFAAERIPPRKLLLGLNDYALSWSLPRSPGSEAQRLSPAAAQNLAVAVGAEIRWDAGAGEAFFSCTDAAGRERALWFEDLRSLLARLELVREYGLGGFCFSAAEALHPALLLAAEERFDTLWLL